MKGYMIVTYRQVADEETMQAYANIALPAMQSLGGRFMIRASGQDVEAREGGIRERTVLLEFPSKQQAIDAYDSPAYQEALSILEGKVQRDVRFVEG